MDTFSLLRSMHGLEHQCKYEWGYGLEMQKLIPKL